MNLKTLNSIKNFIRSYSLNSGETKLKEFLETSISDIKLAGTWKHERVITGKQGSSIKVQNTNQEILNFCANNYLGLSSHPSVIEAGMSALKTHGAGLSSVRFICGTTDLHLKLEKQVAKFHNREDAILYASCFDANAGIFESILSGEDAIISDELNHASIIDGIRLCKAKKWRYKNGDVEDLRRCLLEAKDCRLKMVATDGVFSMDGKLAPLKEIASLTNDHGALLFVDDCHATGFVGNTGRGSEEFWKLNSDFVTIINSTLGKALGGAMGGYTVGPKYLIDILRQRSRPYLFSNTLPPSVVAASSQAIELITKDNDGLISKIQSNTARFRQEMTGLGFKILGDPCHPICPVMLGDAKLASQFAEEMLKKGIYVIGFSYPVVPKDKARIRVQISAVHSTLQIDRAILAFKQVGTDLKFHTDITTPQYKILKNINYKNEFNSSAMIFEVINPNQSKSILKDINNDTIMAWGTYENSNIFAYPQYNFGKIVNNIVTFLTNGSCTISKDCFQVIGNFKKFTERKNIVFGMWSDSNVDFKKLKTFVLKNSWHFILITGRTISRKSQNLANLYGIALKNRTGTTDGFIRSNLCRKNS